MKRYSLLCLAVLALVLSGCRSQTTLNGPYTVSSYGIQYMTARFAPDGTVKLTSPFGAAQEARYRVEGKEVTIENAGKTMKLLMEPDGSMRSDAGITIRKE